MTSPIHTKLSVGDRYGKRSAKSALRGEPADRQLIRWGGIAGLAGVVAFIGTVAVVVAAGLPDASDPETLTDFADLEAGRIAEHFLYLSALVLFGLHVLVLHRVLKATNSAAALFGAAVAEMGLAIMAASSVLHISTAPLADLYTAADTPPEDLRAIEYAWHGAQSVFDTMLTTGLLLVPVGMILLGVAMKGSQAFGSRFSMLAIALGTLGFVGAVIETVDTTSDFSAATVLAIVLFHVATGWRTLTLAADEHIDLTDLATPEPAHRSA